MVDIEAWDPMVLEANAKSSWGKEGRQQTPQQTDQDVCMGGGGADLGEEQDQFNFLEGDPLSKEVIGSLVPCQEGPVPVGRSAD